MDIDISSLELALSETLIAEFYPFTDTFPDNLYNVWPVVRLDSGLQAFYYSPNAVIIFSSSTSAGLENT